MNRQDATRSYYSPQSVTPAPARNTMRRRRTRCARTLPWCLARTTDATQNDDRTQQHAHRALKLRVMNRVQVFDPFLDALFVGGEIQREENDHQRDGDTDDDGQYHASPSAREFSGILFRR